MQQEHAEAHRQFTGIDDFITRCYLNWEPMWTPLMSPACQNQLGFGMAVLNCLQELKNRPIQTALRGLKCAEGYMLAALSTLQQWPYVHLFELFILICNNSLRLKALIFLQATVLEAKNVVSNDCLFSLL
jgi:hypothetical protein